MTRATLLLCASAIVLVCTASAASDDEDAKLVKRAAFFFPKLPTSAPSDANPANPARIDLGRLLYFDNRLSKNRTISCNSCHPLDKFGADGLPTSPGFRGQLGGRNSPTTLNAALQFAQFWDGRSPDVEDQAKGPVLNPVEMGMPDAAAVETVLRAVPDYRSLFADAFPGEDEPVTFDNMALAIASFERRLLTPSRFDDFVGGDTTALTEDERRGLATFMNTGCVTCHMDTLVGGSMFQKVGLVHKYETADAGRFEVTGNEAHRLFFKVPSLRNVAETAPYFSDGSIVTLSEAVRTMGWVQLGEALSDEQVADIVVFLGSLTGTLDRELSARPALPPAGSLPVVQ